MPLPASDSDILKEVKTPTGTTLLTINTDLLNPVKDLLSPAQPSSILSPVNKEDVEIQLPTPVAVQDDGTGSEMLVNPAAPPDKSNERVDQLKKELLSLARPSSQEAEVEKSGADLVNSDTSNQAEMKLARR